MSFTTNEQLEKLAQGALDWDAALNQNFEKIEKGRHIPVIATTPLSYGMPVYIVGSLNNYVAGALDGVDCIGLTSTAISSGTEGQVTVAGPLLHAGSIVGPQYCSANSPGILTQTAPNTKSVPVAYSYTQSVMVVIDSIAARRGAVYTNSLHSLLGVEHSATTGKHSLSSYVGTYELAASDYSFIPNTDIVAGSIVIITATNTIAAQLQGSEHATYISTISPGSGFGVSTATGSNAVGTETFNYHYLM